MFKNNFKIAVRSLWRNKSFSAINIFGLAIGITTCLLIMLYVQNEFSHDRYNEKADQIVRVTFRGKMNGGEIKEANVMPPVAQTFKKDFPEVLDATRIHNSGRPRITYGNKTFRDNSLAFVDSNFLNVFTLPLVDGDVRTALIQPNTAIISKETAKTYFGHENPIGKVLLFKDNNAALTITGVFDKVPVNSHFHFDFFASIASLPEAKQNSWMTSNFYTYLVLPKSYNYKNLQVKLAAEVDKYIGPQLQQAMGVTMSQFRQSGNDLGFFLQPLTDIHLHSDFTGNMEAYGNIQYVYIFIAVAIFMLLIACVNFMNLSTASASKRAREVGIRKVMGSLKMQLVRQFLLESLLLTAVALVLALGLMYLVLPFFNGLTGQNLSLNLKATPWLLPALVLVGLFTGILAGSYPAFFLSTFNPVAVLKGKFTSGKKSISLHSGLVVFQFFISVTLIIGTVVVYKQLSYIQHIKLGYDKNQVAVVEESYWLGNNVEAFKQQLLEDPRVLGVSSSGYLPAGNSYGNNWDHLTTQSPFTYSFLDDRYNNTYKAEQNTGRILAIFAGMTIFVAGFGLFALATFTAEQRTKEIGIRKVLGANVTGIVSLLSKDFLKLVFIAFLIASPVAWFVMNKWLQDFAYRINISWWVFALTAFAAILITIITVSFQAIKAALANPVKSLRTE